MVAFMLISKLTKLESIWQRSSGNFRSVDGTKTIKNRWADRRSLDYLHFMKFEAMIFIWHFTFLMMDLFQLFGISYSLITLNVVDPRKAEGLQLGPLPLPCIIANISMCISHICSLLLLVKIMRRLHLKGKVNPDTKNEEEENIIFQSKTDKFLGILIILGYIGAMYDTILSIRHSTEVDF